MLDRETLQRAFEAGRPYPDYAADGTERQTQDWAKAYERVRLTEAQRGLVANFVRRINVLVTSGLWCGDCVAQCPMLARIEEANPERIRVRFVDRDEHRSLAERIAINEGLRVPTAVFINEDWDFVALLGDRTLSRYRAIAAKKLGASCPLPGAPVPQDEIDATLQDWIDEFERVHLLLRLSPKLRERYDD